MIDDAMINRLCAESADLRAFARACYAAGQRDEQRELIALAAAQGWGMRNNDPFEDSVREICDMRACTEDKT